MLIYKDAFNGDELLSDSYVPKEVEGGIIYEVATKQITRSIGNIDIGANASEEDPSADEGADDTAVTVNNLVDAHGLVVCVVNSISETQPHSAYTGNTI